MKNIRLSIISCALLLFFCGSVAQAETIGRVLVAVGDTTALRNGVVVKLVRGAAVQNGDALRTGETSNMQVRFTDESITALRSNSEFRIDDYKFEGGTNIGKSFFSLVKGGMRSITGLIGRFNRENYAIKAATATIGIRGTHFALAQCSNDCFNKDGSQAENGLFGGVTEGRIAVNNQAGEKEFGKNEFFHVSSSDAAPKPLLVPPSFLRDQLEGQAKSKEGKTKVAKADAGEEKENGDNGDAENGDKDSSGEDQESAEAEASGEDQDSAEAEATGESGESTETAAAGEGGESTETAVAAGEGGETVGATTGSTTATATTTTAQSTSGTSATAPVAVDTSYTPTEQTVVQTSVSGGLINTVVAGQTFPYKIAMANAWVGKNTWTDAYGSSTYLFGHSDAWMDEGTLTVIDSAKLLQADDVLFADFVINQTSVDTFLMNAYSASGTSDYYYYAGECGWNCVGTLDGTVSFTWTKTASTDTGSSAAAANLKWGRFTMTGSENVLTGTYAGNTNSETSYEHWASGDSLSVAALPTTGWYTWSHVGGTRPTDQNGNIGTAVVGGIVGVNFTGAGGADVTLTQATWSMPVTGNNYTVQFSNVPVTISQGAYSYSNAGWSETGTETFFTPITVGATCQGACSNQSTAISVSSVVSPMLFGANAEGLAAGITTSIPVPTGASPAEKTASVQVYQKDATPQAW